MKKILILCTIFINSIIVTKAQYSPGALAGRIGRAWSGEGASELANEAISGFISAANTVGTSATAGAEFGGSAATLASNECTPNFSDDVNARMNFLCAPQSECQSCYDQARQNMNFFRRQLERLHCIYINTKKFTTDAIAFGDNASGIHAMTGIVWQRERAKINANFEKLKITYDTRKNEFLGGLQTSLQSFAACENRWSNSGDWYQKAGFIYYEFMVSKYQRMD